ncbi:protein-arginine deiminase family protein [Gloeocapsopsis dulcis]|uniref:Protein-arginine deiminase n=1 Tax=Gloeocapsopsis dulcis AAB1 = 1H9 TaxID=1433147 RepID=A0A6N8FYF5_9CHRO|nr:protein-arginine deiminase family protein [Gloeocapsopsis dulcis]MUL37981.1 protein-arginine deiminase [Gloeocapsopsis dulcis AAB1 = 1H9]WNN91542.1 protein-arginine deiminase family protein [Gloeocapsopsis dulcis]
MRNLLQVETFNELHSRSLGKNRDYEDILVVDQPLQISLKNLAPSDSSIVSFKIQGEIEVYSSANQLIDTQTPVPLKQTPNITLIARTFSDRLKDRSLQITFQDVAGRQLSQVQLKLTCLRICLDVDADRDGIIEENNPHKGDWQWGVNGHGAILVTTTDRDLVHSDSEYNKNNIKGLLDLKDSSFMIVRRVGSKNLPSGCEIYLSISQDTAKRICIYDEIDKSGYELIGSKRTTAKIKDTDRDILLAIKGLSYPDVDFDGMVEITLNLTKDGETIYSDRVVFRVAPWMMTPNTLPPITVFVSRLSTGVNKEFIEDLRKVVGKAKVQLDPVPLEFHKDDPWMRDEIEIGYTQAPGKFIHVVLDSPRDRGLDHFAKRKLIGSDFGYVIRKSRRPATKLDSFGNLEVSPPVTVKGVSYPFGRLIFGGTRQDIIQKPRRKLKVLRDFFFAQKIQAPLEIFSDWLSVGHIDEFMTFVPAPHPKGFQLLLASPKKCYDLLYRLRDEGHSHVLLRQGKQLYKKPADISVAEVLDNQELAHHNQRYQEHINWNREVLKEKLDLSEEDIIDIPALFQDDGDGRAETFFPNMVNMIVLKQHLAIPKPFGPQVDAQCQFEAYVKEVLEPLDLVCHFIDDWDPYFRGGGEIHCGTNTSRQPFAQKWWEIEPTFFKYS